jgi:hypothetical protein
MSIVAPKGRKHLSADALFDLVRNGFADIPDYCSNDTDISLTDALMSAFAMFALKSRVVKKSVVSLSIRDGQMDNYGHNM